MGRASFYSSFTGESRELAVSVTHKAASAQAISLVQTSLASPSRGFLKDVPPCQLDNFFLETVCILSVVS